MYDPKTKIFETITHKKIPLERLSGTYVCKFTTLGDDEKFIIIFGSSQATLYNTQTDTEPLNI